MAYSQIDAKTNNRFWICSKKTTVFRALCDLFLASD